jgi:hippurate hydrolase
VAVNEHIISLHDEMTGWRRHLHAHPETAFEEHATADYVAERLAAFGLAVDRGLAGTGVVATLAVGDGPAIGLRADMDALPIDERTQLPYRSVHSGRMHACGHDGHTAMLLGAAKHLARSRSFRGTVYFIFQPAEENEGGGRVMVEQGLFQRFPMASVYGMHNWPGLLAGVFAVRAGPMMAACDIFEIIVRGKGAHGAMPHLGTDAMVAAAAIATALQTVVSREVDPLEAAVVSVTQIQGGETWNVIAERALLRGTARCFKAPVQDIIEVSIGRIAGHVAAAHGCTADIRYQRQYPATVNSGPETECAAEAAARVVGAENVIRDAPPTMGSEDFAFMLQARPGCYVWIGGGRGDDDASLHNPRYDFNDAILPIGASYWTSLVEAVLR